MTEGTDGVGPDPAAEGARKRPWYRGRGTIAIAVIAVLVAITVVTDLPHHASRAEQASTEASVVKAVDNDVRSCAFAVQQTFELYHDETTGSLTADDRSRIPRLMADDQAACSFTNGTIVGLSTLTVSASTAGRQVGAAVNTVTLWATSDALAAIEQIQTLSDKPHDAAALAKLAKEERLLAGDRAKADAEVASASRILRIHIPDPDLPNLPNPHS